MAEVSIKLVDTEDGQIEITVESNPEPKDESEMTPAMIAASMSFHLILAEILEATGEATEQDGKVVAADGSLD